ncbi:MAG TPA: PQQ-dependent sugar dehydrogenase, partial [Anaerolineae bacterium]|nr:PQQ-dependent sugar dehydrogenase [Anaerolineae bacterium]
SVAPAGVTFYRGDAIPEWKHDLFVCHWKTGELHHFKLNRSRTAVAAQSIVAGAVCNLDIETGADGALYFLRNDPSHPGGRLRGIYRITRDATLYASTLSPSSPIPAAGDVLTYTVRLVHYGTLTTTFTLTSSLPPSTTLIDGSLQAGAGTILGSSAGITWTAWITPNTTLVAAYSVSLSDQIAAPTVLTNTMRVSTDRAQTVERVATIIVNGQAVYLPILVRAFEP